MNLVKPDIDSNMNKEQAILYYLFIDEQLLCAWWDYLEIWDEEKYLAYLEKNEDQFKKAAEELGDSITF